MVFYEIEYKIGQNINHEKLFRINKIGGSSTGASQQYKPNLWFCYQISPDQAIAQLFRNLHQMCKIIKLGFLHPGQI